MSFFQKIRYTNNPTGYENSTRVTNQIKAALNSYFGQDVAFEITFVNPPNSTLDARICVFTPNYDTETLEFCDEVMASSFTTPKEAIAGIGNPENVDYVAGQRTVDENC